MKTVIVCSQKDTAGTNIKQRLLDAYPFEMNDKLFDSSPVYSWNDKLIVTSQKDIVFVEKLDETFGECRYVFLSRHRAESGIPSLTAHFTGEFWTSSLWREFERDCKVFAEATEELLDRTELIEKGDRRNLRNYSERPLTMDLLLFNRLCCL